MYGKIVITGSVGVGKTTVSQALGERLKMKVLHVTDYVKEHRLYSGEEDGELVVKMNSLKKELNPMRHIIMESHLLCEFKLSDSIVVVLRCDPKKIRGRLELRGYSPQKIRDNLETEALDYCTINAIENYGEARVHEIDVTNMTPEGAAEETIKLLRGKRKSDEVDYSSHFL